MKTRKIVGGHPPGGAGSMTATGIPGGPVRFGKVIFATTGSVDSNDPPSIQSCRIVMLPGVWGVVLDKQTLTLYEDAPPGNVMVIGSILTRFRATISIGTVAELPTPGRTASAVLLTIVSIPGG